MVAFYHAQDMGVCDGTVDDYYVSMWHIAGEDEHECPICPAPQGPWQEVIHPPEDRTYGTRFQVWRGMR